MTPGVSHPIARPVVKPVTVPVVSPQPSATSVPTPSTPPVPLVTPPVPLVTPPVPAPPVQLSVAPAVAFAWVPYPVIASSTASVGFTADANAARVLCSLDGAPASVCAGSSVSYSGLADGPHTVTLWAENADGLAGAQLTTGFTVDTTGATVSWTSTPPAQLASSSVTLGFTASDPTAATWCSLDGAAASVCGSPLNLSGLADGPHAVSVYTVDAVGNIGPAIQTSFTVDTTGPTVTLTGVPAASLTTSTAGVSFTLDDPGATAWCSLDGAVPTACTSPVSYSGLPDGPHTIAVYAVDALGNVGALVATSFAVDTTAPVVTSITAPAGAVPSQSVSIPFTVDDPAATAWCSLDGAPATACGSPVSYDNLADGVHTLAIYAVDAAGNQGPTQAATFTVSTTAPTVTLGAVPPALSSNTAASVAFSVDDPTATAWCSLDGAAPTACTSPVSYSGLGDGLHTVDIYATSLGGQQSASASTAFTVDTQAPVLTVSQAPSGTVSSANAKLTYTVDDPSATVWCSVDGAAATACASPVDFGALPAGPHTVSLQATDPAGNSSASSSASFTIDNTGPTVTFTSTPPASSANRTATASFSTDDPAATTWCSLDGNAAQACTGSVSYSNLSDGSHSISVYAVDLAGNRGSTKTTSFSVLTAGPTLIITPPSHTSSKWVTFGWLASPGSDLPVQLRRRHLDEHAHPDQLQRETEGRHLHLPAARSRLARRGHRGHQLHLPDHLAAAVSPARQVAEIGFQGSPGGGRHPDRLACAGWPLSRHPA